MNTTESEPRLLVIGGSGFIGSRVVQTALAQRIPVLYTYARNRLELPVPSVHLDFTSDFQHALHSCLTTFQPTTILHCALPHVYANETTHQQVSVESVRAVTDLLRQQALTSQLVYLSSNAVFASEGPYSEEHKPDAWRRNDSFRAYGMTRAEGEQVALGEWKNTLVVRTSTVDGRAANGNFWPRLGNLLTQLQAGKIVRRFQDRTISTTVVENLVDALLETAKPTFVHSGVLHVAGRQPISDFEYVRLLVNHLGLDERLVVGNLMTDSPQMTGTAHNIALDVRRAQSWLKTKLWDVTEQLAVLLPHVNS